MRLPKALGVSFSCFSLALALTTVCSAQEKKVKVWIGGMHCAQVTNDDDRDEVYILVRAKESTGREIEHRLPHPDDYFESRTGTHLQQEGWTNKNQEKQPAPVLWDGKLAPGQSVAITVFVGEQDNDQRDLIVKVLTTIAEELIKALTEGSEPVKLKEAREKGIGSAKAVYASRMGPASKGDQGIYAVALALQNNDGTIESQWSALDETEIRTKTTHPDQVGTKHGARLESRKPYCAYTTNVAVTED